MSIELQNIDCNCNNCIFMDRDSGKFSASLDNHHKWQIDYFNTLKNNIIKKAKHWLNVKGDLGKWNDLLMESDKMKFQFDKKEAYINYGKCTKLNKPVSFIPNTCQIDTQDCFQNRKLVPINTV